MFRTPQSSGLWVGAVVFIGLLLDRPLLVLAVVAVIAIILALSSSGRA